MLGKYCHEHQSQHDIPTDNITLLYQQSLVQVANKDLINANQDLTLKKTIYSKPRLALINH